MKSLGTASWQNCIGIFTVNPMAKISYILLSIRGKISNWTYYTYTSLL